MNDRRVASCKSKTKSLTESGNTSSVIVLKIVDNIMVAKWIGWVGSSATVAATAA